MALVSFQAKLCHLAALAASASLGWPDQERSPWARSGCHPKTFISEASCDAWLAPNPTRLYNSQTHMAIACNCSAAYQTVLRNIATWFLLETKGPTKLSCPWHSASCARMQVRTVQLPNRGGWLKGRWDSHGGLQLKCLRSLRSIVTLMIFDDDVADSHWTKAKHGTPICSLWESSLAIFPKMLFLYGGGQICNRE